MQFTTNPVSGQLEPCFSNTGNHQITKSEYVSLLKSPNQNQNQNPKTHRIKSERVPILDWFRRRKAYKFKLRTCNQ